MESPSGLNRAQCLDNKECYRRRKIIAVAGAAGPGHRLWRPVDERLDRGKQMAQLREPDRLIGPEPEIIEARDPPANCSNGHCENSWRDSRVASGTKDSEIGSCAYSRLKLGARRSYALRR